MVFIVLSSYLVSYVITAKVVLSSYLVSYVITAKVVLSVTTGLELSLWAFAQHLLVFCTLAGYKVSN